MADQEMTSVLAEPIPVEFPYAGGWYPGVLLGWRHDVAHGCRVRVRCVIGGLRRTSWMTLADLRLPEPPAPSSDDPSSDDPSSDDHGWDAPRPRTGDWTLTPA